MIERKREKGNDRSDEETVHEYMKKKKETREKEWMKKRKQTKIKRWSKETKKKRKRI